MEDKPKIQHWVLQVLPPLILLYPLTGNGTALWYGFGLGMLVLVISVVSILYKLIRIKKYRYFLLRPALAIIMVIILYFFANQSYESARNEATGLANEIQAECQKTQRCPVQGNDDNSTGRTNLMLGKWQKYHALYYLNEDYTEFKLTLLMMGDIGAEYTGGAGDISLQEQHFTE